MEKGKKIPIPGDINSPVITIRRAFRKFIVSQVCTFPREDQTANQHFVEEYVLPQLLTEAIRQHKYDGIIYPSTKFIGKIIEFGKGWHNMLFKANLAMFTNYDPRSKYDDSLFKNFVPHVLDLKTIKLFNASAELVRLSEAMLSLEDWLNRDIPESELRNRFLVQLRHFEKKVKTYEHLIIDGKSYLECYAGKVEINYMKSYFRYIVMQIKNVYPAEYEREEAKRSKIS